MGAKAAPVSGRPRTCAKSHCAQSAGTSAGVSSSPSARTRAAARAMCASASGTA